MWSTVRTDLYYRKVRSVVCPSHPTIGLIGPIVDRKSNHNMNNVRIGGDEMRLALCHSVSLSAHTHTQSHNQLFVTRATVGDVVPSPYFARTHQNLLWFIGPFPEDRDKIITDFFFIFFSPFAVWTTVALYWLGSGASVLGQIKTCQARQIVMHLILLWGFIFCEGGKR